MFRLVVKNYKSRFKTMMLLCIKMSNKKLALPDDVFNQFVNIMINSDITETQGKFFSLDSLKQSDAIKKYLDSKMGDQLRTFICLRDCDKLRPKYESTLQEKDLITIFRAVLRHKNYKITGMNDSRNVSKTRIYYIQKC